VLGEEVTRSAELPRTGIDPTVLLAVGLAFMLGGSAFLGGAQRLAKRDS
jgi:LPXTG-motif cell wall-anchored protein